MSNLDVFYIVSVLVLFFLSVSIHVYVCGGKGKCVFLRPISLLIDTMGSFVGSPLFFV